MTTSELSNSTEGTDEREHQDRGHVTTSKHEHYNRACVTIGTYVHYEDLYVLSDELPRQWNFLDKLRFGSSR